jgi:hemoglobin
MKRVFLVLVCLGLLSVLQPGFAPAKAVDTTAQKTLYQRLGGYDAIAAVVDDFIGRLAGDQTFARFFLGFSVDSKKKLRQHIVNQFCEATGGPCIYTGRTMKASHMGLGITEAEWQAGAKHLVAALDKFKVPAKEKDDVIAFVSTLKADIVEKP